MRQYYETTSANSDQQQQQQCLQPSPNEAEFRSYIILLNLNESNILGEIQRWPPSIRHSAHVRFALTIYFAYNCRNYARFFRLIRSPECSYLHACILHRYFYRVRADAFRTIFTGENFFFN